MCGDLGRLRDHHGAPQPRGGGPGRLGPRRSGELPLRARSGSPAFG